MTTLFSKTTIAIAALLLSFLFGVRFVSAATFTIAGGTYASVNLDAASYTAGTSMSITGAVYTAGATENAAYLYASTPGSAATIINVPSSAGNWVYGSTIFSVPASAGDYNVTFTGGIYAPDGPIVTSVGAGKRPYVGGSIDDHIECNANLSGPTGTAGSLVGISYRLRNAYNPSDTFWGSCYVSIYSGYDNGFDNGTYYGEWIEPYYVDYSCADYADNIGIASNIAC